VLANQADSAGLAGKICGAPAPDSPEHAPFLAELEALRSELIDSEDFRPGPMIAAALARLREDIAFMASDRAMDQDIAAAMRLVEQGELLSAARAAG
jgi:histidine ammonia-lyase